MNNMMNLTNQIGIYLSSAYNALQNHGATIPAKKNVKNLSAVINTVIAGEGMKRYQDLNSAAAAGYQGEPDLRLVYDNKNNFYGLYRYTLNNGFQVAETQFNAKSDMLWDKKLYTNIGIITGSLNTNTPSSAAQLAALMRVGQDFGLSLGLERLIDASYLFANTTYTKLPKTLRTYYTNNMAYMFYNCRNLKTFPNLYYHSIENMENMFLNCSNFDNQSVNLVLSTLPNFSSLINASSNNIQTYLGFNYNLVNYGVSRLAIYTAYNNGWDVPMDWATIVMNYNTVSNPTIISTTLEEPEDGFDIYMIPNFLNTLGKTTVSTLNISGIGNLQGASEYGRVSILGGCENLTDVSFDSTANLRYMDGFFNKCYNLKNISGFSTQSALRTSNLFQYCYNLDNIPALHLNNTIQADGMFAECVNIKGVPELNLGLASNIACLFSNCCNLATAPAMNTSNALYFNSVFEGCNSLTYVYNYNTTRAISMASIFSRCENLINIPDLITENVSNMSRMFYNCYNLVSLPNMNVSRVRDASGMFYKTKIAAVPASYEFTSLTNTANMFAFTSIVNIPNIYTNGVSDASSMFYNCFNIVNFAQSEFNLSKATDLSFTFGNVQNVIDFPNITTTKSLRNTTSMFFNCNSMINAPAFETASVQNTMNMFYNCENLVDVPLYNLSAATRIENMFYNCFNLSDTSYTNIISGLPLAAQLTNQYVDNIGLNIEKLTVTHMVMLRQKGYLGIEIPPYGLNYSMIQNTQNYIIETIERGI